MKPMLASPPDPKYPIRFPAHASPKIDGVRALVTADGVVSRSLKPIRNKYVQRLLNHAALLGFDGELVVGAPTDPNCMQSTTSGVMSAQGVPDVTYYVFDMWNRSDDFTTRANAARTICLAMDDPRIRFLEGFVVCNQGELDAYEEGCLAAGYEGVMVRSLRPGSGYKFGRATAKSQELLKLKRFEDAEAVVIGVEELMHNENEAKTNALGRTERSTSKAGLRGAGTLGKLIVRREDGVEFGIGTGFTAAQRDSLWKWARAVGNVPGMQPLVGQLVTYKHFANGGVKDAPRFPVFKAFRDEEDMS